MSALSQFHSCSGSNQIRNVSERYCGSLLITSPGVSHTTDRNRILVLFASTYSSICEFHTCKFSRPLNPNALNVAFFSYSTMFFSLFVLNMRLLFFNNFTKLPNAVLFNPSLFFFKLFPWF